VKEVKKRHSSRELAPAVPNQSNSFKQVKEHAGKVDRRSHDEH
jgi:hypothetical protein